MRRKHEIVNGRPISCWACSDKYEFAGRYTVVYLDTRDERGQVQYLGMNARPLHPQGFGMHGEMPIRNVTYRGRGGVFDERIQFKELPPDCQRAVLQDLEPKEEDTRASVHPLQDIMDAINTQDNRGTSQMKKLQDYRVTWEIDVYAPSPRHAARVAREIQRDPGSIATVFTVKTKRGEPVTVVLEVAEEDDPK
jgi:hypothetical protein